jgi:hypothetical protein
MAPEKLKCERRNWRQWKLRERERVWVVLFVSSLRLRVCFAHQSLVFPDYFGIFVCWL